MKISNIKNLIKDAVHPKEWGAPRALSVIMMLFGQRGRTYYDGAWHDPKLLTYKLQGKSADKVPIMFWGGSEYNGAKRKYFSGTVFDWLIDCCYYELAQGDPDLTLLSFLKECGAEGTDSMGCKEAQALIEGCLAELESHGITNDVCEDLGIR